MRSDSSKNCVPKIPAAQFTLDQTHKCLPKLRWVGKELEAQTILEALDDAGLSHRFQMIGANEVTLIRQRCRKPLRFMLA